MFLFVSLFEAEQRGLDVQPAGVADKTTVGANDAVTKLKPSD